VSLTLFAQCGGNAALGSAAYLSLADEANALSTFANNGKVIPQTAIVSIKLNGKTKLAWKAPAGKQVIRPDTAYIINDIMSDPNASYLPGSCTPTDCTNAYKFQRYNGWHFAVDSGNTNNGFDALMASWSTKYAVVSWAGSHLRNVSLPAHEALIEPLTRGLMEAVHNATTPANWQQPRDMRILPAYVFAGHIHYGDVEPSPASDLYPSWYGN
jgi:membrane peptidoglycan carboxypeptidase